MHISKLIYWCFNDVALLTFFHFLISKKKICTYFVPNIPVQTPAIVLSIKYKRDLYWKAKTILRIHIYIPSFCNTRNVMYIYHWFVQLLFIRTHIVQRNYFNYSQSATCFDFKNYKQQQKKYSKKICFHWILGKLERLWQLIKREKDVLWKWNDTFIAVSKINFNNPSIWK